MAYQQRPTARPPSTQQVLERQKMDAERDRHHKTARSTTVTTISAAPAATAATVPARSPEPALPAEMPPDNRTPVQQYLDEVAPAMIVGRMVKFAKEGEFKTPDDDAAISDDVDFVALTDQTQIGWIKFNGDGEPPDREMGLLYDGFVMQPRSALGDDDQAAWQIGLDGRPADPWQHQINLVLQRGDTAELFTYTTTSITGRRAIGNLLRHYDRMQKTHPDMYPVIRLKVGGFQHRDERVGWVPVPVLAVVGRAPEEQRRQTGQLAGRGHVRSNPVLANKQTGCHLGVALLSPLTVGDYDMKTVKALMVDPVEQIVYGIDLPVTPPKSDDTPGPQISVEQVLGLIDRKHPNGFYLPGDKDFIFFDDNLFSSKKCHFQLGPGYGLLPGRCIIIGRDIETGDYRDVAVTGEEIAHSIIWTRHAPRRTKTADTPREAIQRLVDYLYADEEEHFSECAAPPDHIFHSVRIVAAWLDKTVPSPRASVPAGGIRVEADLSITDE
jgi:hypothetical protein